MRSESDERRQTMRQPPLTVVSAPGGRTLRQPPPPEAHTRPPRRSLPYPVVALVLQGGGALGAYQAGVFQGLDEAGIAPSWISGVSIGAINSAIIAGNPPEQRVSRLRDFWETVCRAHHQPPLAELMHGWVEQLGGDTRKLFNAFEALRVMLLGQCGFFVPRVPPAWLAMRLPPQEVGLYDTSQLKTTLESLVDFDRVNAGETRVTVSAVNVRTGNFDYFDNTAGHWKGRLRAEHFMASGALPPGFPPIEIDGEYYWDGALVSNTPLLKVLQAWPRPDTLAFQVDLWSAKGVLPTTIWDAEERRKDIVHSSRTRAITDLLEREQQLRRLIRELLNRIPDEQRCNDASCKEAHLWATDRRVNVVQLVYREKEWDGLAKDYEFGVLTMRDHWASGLDDVRRSLAHKHWLDLPPAGRDFVTHDVHRDEETPAG
jgi:NTE family protein